LQKIGVGLRFNRPFFKEFTVKVSGNAVAVVDRLLKKGFHAGLPLGQWYSSLENCLTIAVTEKRTRKEIDGLVTALSNEARR
jgi:glycine cleavage system P protein (glycine dehydrogenase) subunit 1